MANVSELANSDSLPDFVSDCRLMLRFARKNGTDLSAELEHEIAQLDSILKQLKLALMVVLSLVSTVGTVCAGNVFADDFVIGVSAKWVRGVEERIPGKEHDGSPPSAPLYFWMRYEGNQAALNYIKETGGLPIRHKWSVSIGGIVSPEQPDRADIEKTRVPSPVGIAQQAVYTEMTTVPLSIGTNDHLVLAAFEGRLKNVGAFIWRTWSMKKNVSKGL